MTLQEQFEQILQLFQRDIERHYGGRTVGKTLNGDEAIDALIQAVEASLPKEKVLKPRQTSQDIRQLMGLGYNQAIADMRKELV